MGYKIFISYKRADKLKSVIDELIKELAGIEVFHDVESIDLGTDYAEKIINAITEAQVFLAFIGEEFFELENGLYSYKKNEKEDWVTKEIEEAFKSGEKTIIPVLIDISIDKIKLDTIPGPVLKLFSKNAHKIDYENGRYSNINELAEDLIDILEPDKLKVKLKKLTKDKYKIIGRLAEGARANVYEGMDKNLERQVAIKVLINEEEKNKFKASIKDAARIGDFLPNSIKVLEVYYSDPNSIVMTYVKDGTLRKKIISDGYEWSNIDVKNLLLKIGGTLIKLHEDGRNYLNVKPSNIFLESQSQEPYLNPLSFLPDLTKSNILNKLSNNDPGSPVYQEELRYIPPEIFNGGGSNDKNKIKLQKYDQYMLGLIGYELLSKSLPDTTDSSGEPQQRIINFKPLKTSFKHCPVAFSNIILKMTDYDPANRYEDLSQAMDAISEVKLNDFEIARESYERCLSNKEKKEPFFKKFYQELISNSDEAAEKFHGKDLGNNNYRQYDILREAIFILLLFGENKLGSKEPNILTRIAAMHGRGEHDIKKESYKDFITAFKNTVLEYDTECEGENRNDIIKAWTTALQPGIKYMTEYRP